MHWNTVKLKYNNSISIAGVGEVVSVVSVSQYLQSISTRHLLPALTSERPQSAIRSLPALPAPAPVPRQEAASPPIGGEPGLGEL